MFLFLNSFFRGIEIYMLFLKFEHIIAPKTLQVKHLVIEWCQITNISNGTWKSGENRTNNFLKKQKKQKHEKKFFFKSDRSDFFNYKFYSLQ